ncbi:hypothetical protein [Spiroplasma endosymbiont of Andrena trimmerana]|uniref:hypothetical protein n=1 Tax=Spiroplasma endosymbiont of Andrena trimmerana TaxID=3066316 RepID=UPI0030D085C8
MQYDLIIGIDPAGIGNNGIVIYSNETNNIVFNETFNTLTVLWTKNMYKEKFIDKKILVIVENFFLSSKQLLTNPLATPKIIGALMVLVEDIMNWDYLENHPKNKTKIENYKGNIKFTKHEQDAYKHIQYYLRNYKNERESKLCQINSKTK